MKSRHIVLFAVIVALPVAAGGDRTPHISQSSAPAFSQGQVLTIDSAGRFTSAPSATDLRAVLGDALSTSSEGLVEVQSPVPGGGVMVDLQGRFQNAVVLEKDADGNLTVPCVTGAPADARTGEVK